MTANRDVFNFSTFCFCQKWVKSVQSNRSKNLLRILCQLVHWAFVSTWVRIFFWGSVSVLGYDRRVCQGFQVSGSRKCCFAARVYSFWEIRLVRRSDRDHLRESYRGLPLQRVWYTWIIPEWLRKTLQSVYSFWLNMVIPVYWLPWFLFFVIYCRHWLGNQQTCCFRKILQWFHSPCCVPFWRMVKKALILFVVHDCIVRAISVTTSWGFVFVSLEAVKTCIVKCEKCTRSCVMSMTRLLFLK